MGGLVSVLPSGTRWGLCAWFDLGFSAFHVWLVRAQLWERGNREPFKGILRFLGLYPCGKGRKKLHGKGRVGFGGCAGVPAPGDTGHGAGAEQGQEKHPQPFSSSLRDQDGLAMAIHVCAPLRVGFPREKSR